MAIKEATEILAEKDFSVPVEKLYNAWISPEALKQWWRPMGNQLKDVKNEVREGGEVVYTFETTDQKESLIISGNYQEVKQQEKLVYTWNWNFQNESLQDSEFLLTVEFKSNGSGSSISVKQQNLIDDETVQPHHESWEKGLTDLHEYLTRQ